MAEQLKSHEFHRIAKFAAALSTATERVVRLSAQVRTLANSSKAALPIADLTANTARVVTKSLVTATARQYRRGIVTRESNQASSFLEKALSAMFVGAAIVAAAKLWRDAGARLLKTSIGHAVVVRVATAATALHEATTGSEVLASIAEGVSALVGGATLPEGALSTAVSASGAAFLSGDSYPPARDWTAVIRVIRKVGSTLTDEAMTFIRKVASVVGGESEPASGDTVSDRGTAREGSRHRYALASSRWNSIVTSLLRISQSSDGSKTPGIPFPRMATAMLAVPLLVTPAITDLPVGQMRNDSTSATSVVINSAPTIVINSSQAEDIESRILEVLKQHREAIYAQWCAELKRRQRTKF